MSDSTKLPTENIEYVKLAPYLNVELAKLPGQPSPEQLKLKEVYEFFQTRAPIAPMAEFMEFYTSLPIPRYGETKLTQVLNAMRLLKLSTKIHKELRRLNLG